MNETIDNSSAYSGMCPSSMGYPQFCPRSGDPPQSTICCRQLGIPSCCVPEQRAICAYTLVDGERLEEELFSDPGLNWTTLWCPPSGESCCFNKDGVQCCSKALWWIVMLIFAVLTTAFLLYKYVYLARVKRKKKAAQELIEQEIVVIAQSSICNNHDRALYKTTSSYGYLASKCDSTPDITEPPVPQPDHLVLGLSLDSARMAPSLRRPKRSRTQSLRSNASLNGCPTVSLQSSCEACGHHSSIGLSIAVPLTEHEPEVDGVGEESTLLHKNESSHQPGESH